MNYYFGFSVVGLLVFLLPMLPNLLYFKFFAPKADKEKGKTEESKPAGHLLEWLEHGSQALFVAMLLFIKNKSAENAQGFPEPFTLWPALMLLLLVSYNLLWVFYIKGSRKKPLLMAMALLPVAYFILGEIGLGNYPALLPTILFGAVHLLISLTDTKKHETAQGD